MTNSKFTKRALLTSVFAIIVCLAMLIGTTFAWFTDTASTAVNKIQAGNLDIEVSFAKEAKNEDGTLKGELTEFKTIEEATDVFDNDALWEPGRIEYVVFKIENNGSLALKYKFNLIVIAQNAGINVGNEQYMLADYLCASAKIDEGPGVVGSGYGSTGMADIDAFMAKANDLNMSGYDSAATLAEKPLSGINLEGTLKAGEINCVCLAVWMPTTVGNEANAIDSEHVATIDLGIYVAATQYSYENDSFGPDYDAGAEYPVMVSDLTAKYGTDGLKMPEGVVITDDKTGDGENGKTFTITLNDEEAFVYFTQVFDRAAAFEARKAQWGTEGFTKYPSEFNMADLNMWYGPYCSRITVKMGCDVDLNGIEVKSFGMSGYVFQFDGDGHTIKNAKVTATSGDAGFFMSRANVSNVVLDNIQVSAIGCSSAGVVAGAPNSNITNVTVKNCSVVGAKYTGAIAGYDYGDITDCTVENTTVCGQYKVGGIVGYVCTDNAEQQRIVTGNKLINVTVKGDNIWSGKTDFVIGKLVGNWNAAKGTCNNNTFSGTTTATDNIGEIESGCNVQQ